MKSKNIFDKIRYRESIIQKRKHDVTHDFADDTLETGLYELYQKNGEDTVLLLVPYTLERGAELLLEHRFKEVNFLHDMKRVYGKFKMPMSIEAKPFFNIKLKYLKYPKSETAWYLVGERGVYSSSGDNL